MSELRIVNETCIGVNNIHWTNIDPIIVREIKKLLEEKEELKEYVTNELKNFERLINTSPTPSFYQLPYGVCVSVLNKIEKGVPDES